MEFIGERVNDRNLRVCRHFLQHALFVNARDDAMHPTLEVARDVGNGFAFSEPGLGVIEEHYRAAHALDAHFKCDARAKGWLFKNQREEFAAKRCGVAFWPRLDVRREPKQLARLSRAPFRAGEQIVRQQDGR